MSKKELLYYLMENNVSIPITQIIIGMMMTVLLSLFVYWVYKKTYSGVMYSKSFNMTIILVSLITSMVMMIIGSNLALSLGMVGALSIIRFRTAVKDSKDIGFLFWAIGIGLACGTGIYVVGIICSAVIAIVLFLLDRGIYDNSCYLIIVKGENIDFNKVEEIISKGVKRYKLRMKNSTPDNVEATYEIRLIRNKEPEILDALKEIEEIKNINIVSYNGEIAG